MTTPLTATPTPPTQGTINPPSGTHMTTPIAETPTPQIQRLAEPLAALA